MLRLMIERFATYRSAIHGRLWIDGQYVCDTLENEPCCLQEGSYPLVIKFVESEHRKMMVVEKEKKGRVNEKGNEKVNEKENSSAIIKCSNGPFMLLGGSISVGVCYHLGYILHCAHTFDLLFLRVRMYLRRGGEASLEVKGIGTEPGDL